MKKLFFILIIYLTYISLGLPDSLLGVTWPEMIHDFPVEQSAAGLISMSVAVCTVISSLQTPRILKKIGTGNLIFTSVLLTSIGLIGFSLSQSFYFLLIAAVPLGFGAGAIDTSLNDYVSVNLEAYHMNWLHAFWGIGATMGPLIMGFTLRSQFSWRMGYFIIAGLQLFIALVLFLSLPLWKKDKELQTRADTPSFSIPSLIKDKGIVFSLLAFLVYVSLEGTVFLWGSTYLITIKDLTPATASFILSIFFTSLTLGRILSGFVTFWLSNQKMLYASCGILLLGILAMTIGSTVLLYTGLGFIGLGCAAIFPTMMHETPRRFGEDKSSSVIGLQVASGYIGITTLPPLFGVLFQTISMQLFPLFLVLLTLVLVALTIGIEKRPMVSK
ncbi:MAG: MFS transporter [Alkalibacterium sp.]|nr:MFS transporter [Alkalibacterium sp.]